MTKRTRPTFSPEFKLESAQLVIDQGCSVREAAGARTMANIVSTLGEKLSRYRATRIMKRLGL